MNSPSKRDVLLREFARLRLSLDDAPSLAGTSAGLTDLLARVRALPIGSTWADIFPDAFPTGDTRPLPYRPLGDYDYQTLPTGPALHLQWPRATPRMFLDQLVQGARSVGWPYTVQAYFRSPRTRTGRGSMACSSLNAERTWKLCSPSRTGSERADWVKW